MAKQVAWAAAISSSGLVRPPGFSLRAGQETSKVPMCDESKVTLPEPLTRFPFQTVDAFRVVVMIAST